MNYNGSILKSSGLKVSFHRSAFILASVSYRIYIAALEEASRPK